MFEDVRENEGKNTSGYIFLHKVKILILNYAKIKFLWGD